MTETRTLGRAEHLTFKGNLAATRYGWLRLTPAYSVHLVAELLDRTPIGDGDLVLDPYCGTGTTALVCAERGIACHTSDINPFLLWLATAKTRSYGEGDLAAFGRLRAEVAAAIADERGSDVWTPPIHRIETWWDAATLAALGRAMAAIKQREPAVPGVVADLLKIAFCRVMIERSNVSFGHQSMSFKKHGGNGANGVTPPPAGLLVSAGWERACDAIAESARSPIERVPEVVHCDARTLAETLGTERYACVITSPPYPNRMSYVRELRPYMYWLGYLRDAREAGELDWQAIGGTWGIATSNVGRWEPDGRAEVPFEGFGEILAGIAARSPLLSRYVHKYFCDMTEHAGQLVAVTRAGGAVHYIVGNSTFYGVLLPVERIFAALFAAAGLTDIEIRTIRKRTSKKELYEYVVSAHKPA